MSEQEKLVTRANILGGMNALVLEVGDKELLEWWHAEMPKEAEEDDLMAIAENNEQYYRIVRLYAICERENSF